MENMLDHSWIKLYSIGVWHCPIFFLYFQFIDEPLAYLTVHYTKISYYISPNAMSLCGVAVAVLAARLFVKEDLRYRQFGVLLFKVRDHVF